MKEKVVHTIGLLLKGMVIGVANIIPGVSGGTLAITLGIYERLIGTITHLFSKFKENIKFLLPIIIGAGISLLALSKVISYTLKNYEVQTVLFFVGLILGGLPLLLKKIKKNKVKGKYLIVFLLTFALVLGFGFLSMSKASSSAVSFANIDILKILLLFLMGMIASATMVIPGISGSFVLMLMGFYEPIINTISEIASLNNVGHNLLILIPFGIGVVVGIFLIAKLIEWLISKYETITYYGIIGFVVSSIIAILLPITDYDIVSISVGLVLLVIGFVGAYRLSKLQ